MKKLLSLIFSFCAIILFAACDDKTETFDDQWKLANETQFANIIASTAQGYKRIDSQSKNGYIMYKEIKSGNGETPYFTDKVKVLYTGWFKYDWTKDDTYTDNRGQTIYNKKIFSATNSNVPYTLGVNSFIDGFTTALQHMQVGDKWEIWIPWNLGYGASENTSGNIPAYTTLVFEIELVGII